MVTCTIFVEPQARTTLHTPWSALCTRTELGVAEDVLRKEVKKLMSLSGKRGVRVEHVAKEVTKLETKLTFNVLAAASATILDHLFTAKDITDSVSAHAEFEFLSTSHLHEAPQAYMLLPKSVVARLFEQMPVPYRISNEAVSTMTEGLSVGVRVWGSSWSKRQR